MADAPLPATAWVSVGIAVASLIVVPFVLHMIKQFRIARREAKAAELAKVLAMYVTKTEHDVQFERMEETQARNHRENRDFLDTIRTDAHKREGRILASIHNLGSRVDTIFENLPAVMRRKR